MTWKRWVPWAGAFLMIFAMTGCISGEDLEEGSTGDETEETVEPVPEPEPNAPVTGANYGCLDAFVLYENPELDSPLADIIPVEEGTDWEASGDGDRVHVEFFAEDGGWIEHGDDAGTVPQGATYGIACAYDGGVPVVPGEWTYQDGF